MSPPSQKVLPRTVETSKGGGGGTTEVAQEEDEPTGGGRQTESNGATKEGGAREETWGARSRKCTAGPRPQPWWWPTVELTEGGAMEEEWPPTPGGWPIASEQVVEEPEAETESQQARRMPRFRGARLEPRALAIEAEVLRFVSEPDRQRTQVERTGGRGPTEPVGWSDEAQPEERSPEVMSSSPRCIISSPSAALQGPELHSALTPSTAGSLMVGTVLGSRTWSDVCWTQLQGRSSTQSLGFALAHRSWREMALHHRWTLVWSLNNWSPCSSRRRRYSGQQGDPWGTTETKKKLGKKTEGYWFWLVLLSQFTQNKETLSFK